MAANATRAAKLIHKARSSAYVDIDSSFILILFLIAILLVVVSVAAVATSTAARSDELDAITHCYSRSCTPTSAATWDLCVPL